MKKFLIGIFTFLIGFISFSSAYESCACYSCAGVTWFDSELSSYRLNVNGITIFNGVYGGYYVLDDCDNGDQLDEYGMYYFDSSDSVLFCSWTPSDCANGEGYCGYSFATDISCGSNGSSSSSEINVYYNNGSSTSIVCDGENSIAINGLSTLYGTSTFIPFFNISYVDEDNQNLIESYDKDILYLSGGQYHKTYTGDNQWILNLVGGSSNTGGFNIISSGLVVSGDIVSDNLSGNMFKSFIDTGFEVLFSNVPSYIQYVILIVILIIILRAFTKKRKKF